MVMMSNVGERKSERSRKKGRREGAETKIKEERTGNWTGQGQGQGDGRCWCRYRMDVGWMSAYAWVCVVGSLLSGRREGRWTRTVQVGVSCSRG